MPTETDSPVCPRCDEALVALAVLGERLQRCERCDGMWVPNAFVHGVASRPELRTRLDALAKRSVGQGASTGSTATARCPSCRADMEGFQYGGNSGVHIDLCKAHGTWLDRDELGRIVAYSSANPDAEVRPPAPAPKQPQPKQVGSSPAASDGVTAGDVAIGVAALVFEILF